MSTVGLAFGPSPANRAAGLPAGTELTLGERFHRGEISALTEVLRHLCPLISRRLLSKYKGLLANDRAEEIALDALDQAWRRCADYNPDKGRLAAWLWAIADHLAADFCDSPQGQGRLLEVALDVDRLADLRDPNARDPFASTTPTLAEELRDLVAEALEAIPATYRDVLLAFACAPNGDLSSAELAAEQGVSAAAIRKRRSRGYVLLKAELQRLRVEDLFFCHTQTVFTNKGTKRRTENGERRTENGERRTENGERRTENGERIIVLLLSIYELMNRVFVGAKLAVALGRRADRWRDKHSFHPTAN